MMGDSMKRGFTLIELLAVLVLLGLIFGLVMPNILGQFNKKQKELEKSKLEVINSGAKKYCLENLKFETTDTCKVLLETLYNEGEIPFEINDYKVGENDYGDYTCIEVTKDGSDYSYNYEKNC